MRLFTNKTGKISVRNAFLLHGQVPCNVLIATPFYSYSDPVEDLLHNGCSVRLIVRLGQATTPEALLSLISHPDVQIRYFTSKGFHSKLYILGDKIALVGSANLTSSGFQSNQEICMEVSPDDERFEDLVKLYLSYWAEANVLSIDDVKKYQSIYTIKGGATTSSPIDQAVIKEFGKVAPSGVKVGKPKPPDDKIFFDDYKRTYQEFLTAFNKVKSIYLDIDQRKIPEERLPLRIEIDQFFSYIKENFASDEKYLDAPLRISSDLDENVRHHIIQWFSTEWSYLYDVIPKKYKTLQNVFRSKSAIEVLSLPEIFDGLSECHSCGDRLRFFEGGFDGFKAAFIEQNVTEHVRKMLIHLLFDSEDFIERMGDCIFDPAFAINEFKRSGVQELYGWMNEEEVPICNSRTVKALRYLGFDIRVFV